MEHHIFHHVPYWKNVVLYGPIVFLRLKNGQTHGFPLNSSTGWDEHAQNLGISAGDLKM